MNTFFLHLLGWILIHSLWQFAAIGLIVGWADCLLRRSTSAVRYNVLLTGLGLMVLGPLATTVLFSQSSSTSFAMDRPSTSGPLAENPSATIPLSAASHSPDPGSSLVLPDTQPKPDTTAVQTVSSSEKNWPNLEQLSVQFSRSLEAWMGWIVSFWLVGVLFFTTRLSLGWWRIHQLVRHSQAVTEDRLIALLQATANRLRIQRQLKLVVSPTLDSPVVVGLFRATVILPTSFASGLAPDLVEAIFAHELAHVKRLDFLFNLIQSMLESLFFYHPAVWWLSRRIREERENCCDDMAASAVCSAVTVGRALLTLEEQRIQQLKPALGADGGVLAERVRRLLGKSTGSGRSQSGFSLVAAALLVSLFLSVTGILVAGSSPVTDRSEFLDSDFTITFDQDKSLQLIAVRPQHSETSTAWQPDGSPFTETAMLREVPATARGTVRSFDLFFHFRGLENYPTPRFVAKGQRLALNPNADGDSILFLEPDPSARTTKVTVRIPAKQWGPWQGISPQGQLMDFDPIPPSYDEVYSDLQVHAIHWLTETVELRWQHDRELEDRCLIEVVAVLKDGQRLQRSGLGVWDDGNGSIRSRDLFEATREQLDHFEYRLCPFQYQLVVDNIALEPGQKTEVAMEVQRIPTSTFDQSPALPKRLLPESRLVYGLQFDGEAVVESLAYGEGKEDKNYPRIRRWDLNSGKLKNEVPLQWDPEWTRHVDQLILSENRQLAFGSLGDALGSWNANSGELIHQMKPEWKDFGDLTLRFVRATNSGERVVCAGLSNSTARLQDGIIYVWNGQTGELVREIRLPSTGTIRSLTLSEDGKRVAAWPAPGGVGIWDTQTGLPVLKFQNENPEGSWPDQPMNPSIPNQVLGLQFSHDGKMLAIGDLVGIKLLDTRTGKTIRQIRAPFRYNSPVFAFSPNDQLLLRYGASWKNRHESLLWQVATGEPVAMLPMEGSAAAFSSDGRQLAIGRSDTNQAVAVWELTEAQSQQGTNDESTREHSATDPSNEPVADGPAENDDPVPDEEEIIWSPYSKEQWTTGIQVIQRPSIEQPVLVVQYLLRNEAETQRVVDVSFASGPQSLTVNAGHRIESWGGAVGSRMDQQVFTVPAKGVLKDQRIQHRFDMTGLEPATYTLRLGHGFSLPTGQPGTRHGIPFDHKLNVLLTSAKQRPSNAEVGKAPKSFNKDAGIDLSAIQWGEPVAGMRAGVAWLAGSTGPLSVGQLASLDLFVQNVSDTPIQCQMTLPHSMDGWGFNIRNSENKHMPRKQTFFTGIDPRRDLVAELQPGEVVRITGNPSQFQLQGDPESIRTEVKRLQFKVAENLPEESEIVPPYTYGLPEGAYSLKAHLRVGRRDCPSATFALTSSTEFQVE